MIKYYKCGYHILKINVDANILNNKNTIVGWIDNGINIYLSIEDLCNYWNEIKENEYNEIVLKDKRMHQGCTERGLKIK